MRTVLLILLGACLVVAGASIVVSIQRGHLTLAIPLIYYGGSCENPNDNLPSNWHVQC